MSEVMLQLKKAIPIIVVTWILSMITTLAIVYFAPDIFRSWHEVIRFEGHDTDDYWNSFEVPSMHWKIHWVSFYPAVMPDVPEEARFHIVVDGFSLRELPGWNVYGYIGDDYFTGSGWHQIEVYAKGIEWVVIVEAFY